MMHAHINLPMIGTLWNAAAPEPRMPRPHTPFFDPLQAAYQAGQEFYRAALISVVNGRRMMRGLPPISWPAVGATPHEVAWSEGAARLLRYRAPAGDDLDARASRRRARE